METLRKASLVLGCAAFAVCCLFLNLLGGIALYTNNYQNAGMSLIISVGVLFAALIFSFFRKWIFNLLSLILNIAGTLLYIYPIAVLNGIPNSSVPRSSIEILTSRIYPAISVTILLLIVIFADFFSYDRSAERAAKRNEKLKERSRSLTDDEKIV
ncbi:MAG: hypothetical protein SOZ56_00300 [Oscillospiraceae bacterium]|nr:hypothetical protein [Oscillospiraceae bacterium]